MKNILKITFGCLCALAMFTGCSELEDGKVKVTHYAVFELNGLDENGVTIVPQGTDFTDPGVLCMEGTENITSKVTVSSNVNTNELGVYNVTYSAVNVDGFSSSATRTVVVYDPSAPDTDFSGAYTVAEGSFRETTTTGAKVAFSGYGVDVIKLAPGIYQISDYIGGFYDQRAGYGSSYAMFGYFQHQSDNTISSIVAHVNGWGDDADAVEAKYDESTGTIKMDVTYATSLVFHITLEK